MRREIDCGDDADWEAALRHWDARLDLEEAETALDIFGDIAAEHPDDPNAWAWCARAHYFVADYEENARQAGKLFQRGAELGRKAIAIDGDHVAGRFWTATCLGSYAESVNIVKRAALGSEIFRHLHHVWDSEQHYYDGGPARYLGQAMVRQPTLAAKVLKVAMPSMGPAVALRELRRSVENDPPFVFTHQTLGQLAYVDSGDRDTAQQMREAIEKIDLDATPNLAPENHLDLPRARRLLDELL